MATQLDANMALMEIDPSTKEIKATPYFEDYLFNLVLASGGESTTTITQTETAALSADKFPMLTGLVMKLLRQVDCLVNAVDNSIANAKIKQLEIDTMSFVGKVKVTAYTAINKDWIEARSKAVIKLPSNPLANDQVIISNGDGSLIKIMGNGNDIKYTTTDTSINIRNQGTSLHFQLFRYQDTRYWRAR